MIPLCEPVLGSRELEYVSECVNTAWVSSAGSYVTKMEHALAERLAAPYVVACNCGTSALHIALKLSGVQPGDEVIVPTVTFIATANAVDYLGASPVFLDCDEYCNLDVAALERFLDSRCESRDGATFNRASGRRLRAVVPVHVFGTPVDMDPLLAAAAEHGLAVVEDAAESLGSLYKGRACGTLAPVACLSFNGNKIVTSGAGGAIVTWDEGVASRARYLTTQAKEAGMEYIHDEVGYNYRMNNILAALGMAQLETLEERLSAKRRNFARYEALLGSDRLVQQPAGCESNRWFYGYLCADQTARDRVLTACEASGIQVRPLWRPVHLQKPYARAETFDITRAIDFYARLVNLPCSVNITLEQISKVASTVQQADNG